MIYISAMITPTIIMIIVLAGLIEKKNVYDLFCEGAKDGIKITLKMFPTLIGIFLAISMLRSSGFLTFLANLFLGAAKIFNIPSEIIPLAIIRPISGSASMAIATDILNSYGVDSKIGLIASTIMGSTETTLYTIALYTSSIKVKKTRFVLYAALLADFVGIISSVVFWQIMS